MMYDDIKNFNKQFEYEPKIENSAALKRSLIRAPARRRLGVGGNRRIRKFVVCGMGGSHLAADLLSIWKPR